MKGITLALPLAVAMLSGSVTYAGDAPGRKTPGGESKPAIVIVHGAFADGTGWQRVIPILQKDGYFVTAVQNSLASLGDDIATTRRVIDVQKGPVVLVGHSYGGAVITGAAAGRTNVKALVYISAFAPDAGEPIGAFGEKYPNELGAALRADSAGYLTVDRAKFRDLFCRDLPPVEAAVAAATQKPIIGAVFGASVEQAAWKTLPSWYMVAQEDRAINPDLERFYALRMKAKTVEVKSSHVPFISHPKEVAQLIEQAANAAPTPGKETMMTPLTGEPLIQLAKAQPRASAEDTTPNDGVDAVRPFHIHVPQADLDDLRRRIKATRWPERETVTDQSQGVPLSKIQPLVEYWGAGYDWRKAEAKLNALPQFVTTIDGLDIQFIHIRSRHPNALPLIITHGWPGSVFEQIKLIGPLTDPTAHGGKAEDAFDVVIPSLPGYGFSGKPTESGWGSERIGRAWDVLMKRLGYKRYVAQGGDWGAGVVQAMGRLAPSGLLGIHTNLPAALPSQIGAALAGGGPAPAGLSERERASFDGLLTSGKNRNLAYVTMMGARPQAVGYGMTDSPAGLAGWMLVHPGFAEWTYGKDPRQSPTVDEVLDDFTLYWLTNSAASSARLYWENAGANLISAAAQKTDEISVPVAVTAFPEEVFRVPETWARRAYRNLIYFHEADRGGHFAAWEHPELFAGELRAAFRPLR